MTGGSSVWWSWTADEYGLVSLDTLNSSFDTVLAVYTGTSLVNLYEVASNDDATETTQSALTFNAQAGRTYYFVVDGKDAATGTINLNLALQPDSTAPNAPELTFLVANNTDELTLAWLAATDNYTPAEDMSYEVHLSTSANFTPSVSTLKKTVTGMEQANVDALQQGATYYAAVVAKDLKDISSVKSNELEVQTLANPLIFDANNPIVDANDLNLDNPVVSGSQYTFTKTQDSIIPTVGTILAGGAGDEAYLRRIDSVQETATHYIVQTSAATLSEYVTQGRVASKIRLVDLGGTSASTVSAMNMLTGTSAQSGSTYRRIDWDNQLLSIVEEGSYTAMADGFTSYREPETGLYIINQPSTQSADPQQGPTAEQNTVPGEEKVSLEIDLEYEPEFKIEGDWLPTSLNDASLEVSGTLTASITANYNFTASGTYNRAPWQLFRRVYHARYLLGGMPVIQATTLTVNAQLTSSASSEITTTTIAQTSTPVDFGLQYDATSQAWVSTLPTLDFSNSITNNLSVSGGVTAELRLIPQVEIKFYGIAAGRLSVEEYVDTEIGYEIVSNAKFLSGYYPPTIRQPTVFDVNAGLECYGSADLSTPFGKYPVFDKTKLCGPFEYPLFSLPQSMLSCDADENGQIEVIAGTKDGENNAFDDNSVVWITYPEVTSDSETAHSLLLPLHTDAATRVYYSGNGVLGEVGRQFEELSLENCGYCDPIQRIDNRDQLLCYYDAEKTIIKRAETYYWADGNPLEGTYGAEGVYWIVRWEAPPMENSKKEVQVYPDENRAWKRTFNEDGNLLIEGSADLTGGNWQEYTYHPNGKKATYLRITCPDKSVPSSSNLRYEQYWDVNGQPIYNYENEGGSIYNHNVVRYLSGSQCPSLEEVNAIFDYDINESTLYRRNLNAGN